MLLLAGGKLPPLAPRPDDRRWIRALVLTYIAPVVSVAAAAALRSDGYLSQYDAPARFLLAIPIFLFVLRSGWPVRRVLQWVLPTALVIVLLYLWIAGQDPKWPAVRVTTRVVDPLVFGYLSLAFGLMCMAAIGPGDWRRGGRLGVMVSALGLALGIYFSLRSWSRSGWAAVPLIVGIWAYHHWGRRHRMAMLGTVGAALCLPLIAYLLVPIVTARVDEAVQQVAEYSWRHVQVRETSAGLRITFLRIASDLFLLHPWAGVGDTSHAPPLPTDAFSYAAPAAVASAFNSGFHNQIVSNAVRTGVGGLLATAALLVLPLVICLRSWRQAIPGRSREALVGVAYCTTMLVASMTTEVMDLKFTASLYAVMTAVLCGAALGRVDNAGSGDSAAHAGG
jgi:O-antigen ligase